jgi:hypothetical protein
MTSKHSGDDRKPVNPIAERDSIADRMSNPYYYFRSIFGSSLTLKRTNKIELSDTASIELGFVRDQKVEGSNPFAPAPACCVLLHDGKL